MVNMNIDPFIRIAATESCRRYLFLGLAYELEIKGQCYRFGEPHYYDNDLGLSIAVFQVESDAYDFLELCIISLGYDPIREAGPVRVVLFPSITEKESFKTNFSDHFDSARNNLKNLGELTPADYYRATCEPQVTDTIDEPSSHSAVLSVNILDEIQKILWVEYLEEHSDFRMRDLEQFKNNNNTCSQIQVTFRKAKSRDQFVRQLGIMQDRFINIQNQHGSIFRDEKF
jgi:hypothetical protein